MSGIIAMGASAYSVGEATGQTLVAIERTGDLSGAVTVTYGVAGGTATAGSDFVAATSTVSFAPGQATAFVPVTILDDAAGEPTETVTVSIINVSSGFLGAPRTVEVSILDDETPTQEPSVPALESDYLVTEETIIGGLNQPIDFDFDGQGRVFVAQKDGLIRTYDADGAPLGTLLDLRDEVNDRQDRGLLDIALHPDLENNPYLYAFAVIDPPEAAGLSGNAGRDGGGNRYAHVLRYELDLSGAAPRVVEGSKTVLVGGAGRSYDDVSGGGAIDFTDPGTVGLTASDEIAGPGDVVVGGYTQDLIKVDSRSHAGGALAFGPDGALYVSIGDGTSFNFADPRTISVQNINSLAGKVLRIDPITGEGFADNPFAGADLSVNRAKVWQLGLRNPFSMGFDEAGRLFITDTGWNAWEEINQAGPGANFGWPFYEGGPDGTLLRSTLYQDLPTADAFYDLIESGALTVTPAFRAFSHREADPGFQVQAITGGSVVHTGDAYPIEFQNDYFFADFSQGEIYTVDADDRRDVTFLYERPGGLTPVHFAQGPDGTVWYADLVNDEIGRLLIEPAREAVGEVGRVTISQADSGAWTTVTFAQAIQDAVVVIGPATYNGGDPLTIRVRNVTETGFQLQIDEWDYLDGYHVDELVSWMAVSAGTHELEGGLTLTAGIATADHVTSTVDLGGFAGTPVVLAQVASVNGGQAVTPRVSGVTADGFRVELAEEEANDGWHAAEELHWIAAEAGAGAALEVGATGNVIDHTGGSFAFADRDGETALLADMQTRNGGDPATLRFSEIGETDATVVVVEESSGDDETWHVPETVGWLAADVGLLFAEG